jgi:hypothetical protein
MAGNDQLDLQEDPKFQETEWRLQRLAWVIWAALIVAALLGLLGPGPLSNSESSTPDGLLTVGYERFLHYHHPTQLEISLLSSGRSEEPARIRVSRSLLDRIQILRIEPEPERSELSPDGIVYTFPQAEATEHGKVLFHVEFEKSGTTTGQIGLVGAEPATFSQFVYP